MTVNKINSNLPVSNQITSLNDMIVEVNGIVSQSAFSKNEIDVMYDTLIINRKFLRDVLLGNTLTDYTDWSHIKSESGYSIWKITPTNYAYNSLNELYLDDAVLTNQGEATSESAAAFDGVYNYNGSTYTNNTTEAATETGTGFDVIADTSSYLYIGDAATFTATMFEWETRGANYTLVVEYYNGDSGTGWETLETTVDNLEDNTSNFTSDGLISWDLPDDWATNEVNSVTQYWIRISTTTTPTITASCYYLIPGDSVIGKLSLSSTQLLNEEWAWCSYNDSIYATIRNIGTAAYEGDYFINQYSTATNLQNYFIYNHTFKANHEDSTYVNLEGTVTEETVGEDVAIGDLLYMKADGKYWIAKANATATMPAVVMATQAISADAEGRLLHRGYITNNTWSWTVGGGAGLIYVTITGTTGNTMSQTQPVASGDQVQVIGYATAATTLYFDPSYVLVEI